MKRRLFCGSILALLLVCLLPLWAAADTGPKPSITVTPEGFGEDACYLTLLSQTETTGPWSKHESFAASKDSYGDPEADEAVWTAFNDYEDADGFYFLGCYGEVTGGQMFCWSYYPPDTFKVLAYFPDSGTFAVGPVTDREEFSARYTVSPSETGETLLIEKARNQEAENKSFVGRLVLTLALELAVAVGFAFRTKRQIITIVCMNLITQVGLNQAITHLFPVVSSRWYWPGLLVLEVLIFLVEGAVYARLLPRWKKDPAAVCHPWKYALAANVASFGVGLILARLIPGMF